jgi:hypothetical protein
MENGILGQKKRDSWSDFEFCPYIAGVQELENRSRGGRDGGDGFLERTDFGGEETSRRARDGCPVGDVDEANCGFGGVASWSGTALMGFRRWPGARLPLRVAGGQP